MARIFWGALCLLLHWVPASAEEQQMTNIVPGAPMIETGALAPGSLVIFPDGRQSVIAEVRADGTLVTAGGALIMPNGAVSGLPDGQTASIVTASEEQRQEAIAEAQALLAQSEGEPILGTGYAQAQEAAQEKLPGQERAGNEPQKQEERRPEDAGQPQSGNLTLASLLPLTRIGAAGEAASPRQEAPRGPEKKAEAQKPGPKEGKKPETSAKPEAGAKGEAGKKPGKAAQKARPGEALRIPEGAAASGSLDFLEGCWQGTRPEYYSKRTIRECFCFGPGGGSGKRRILDGAYGGRMCIGAAAAHFKGSSLSVTSSRAACTDGERWGQAQMICRGQGEKTPCSWIFQDANGGRQSYEIPLVRVESCGR